MMIRYIKGYKEFNVYRWSYWWGLLLYPCFYHGLNLTFSDRYPVPVISNRYVGIKSTEPQIEF